MRKALNGFILRSYGPTEGCRFRRTALVTFAGEVVVKLCEDTIKPCGQEPEMCFRCLLRVAYDQVVRARDLLLY